MRPVHKSLDVRHSPGRGKGLFASRDIRDGDLLDEAHVLTWPAGALGGHELDRYCFAWPGDREAVAFGRISLVNHSSAPNARIEIDEPAGVIRLRAARTIAADEEITFDYGCDLWFEPVD